MMRPTRVSMSDFPEADLLALIEGDLAPKQAARLRQQLAGDPQMAALVERLREDREMLRTMAEPPLPVVTMTRVPAGEISTMSRSPFQVCVIVVVRWRSQISGGTLPKPIISVTVVRSGIVVPGVAVVAWLA